MGGRAAASQPQQSTSLQHPQADHVRTHVPENADASRRPGWALQWGTGPACGLSGMRQADLESELYPRLLVRGGC